MLVSLTLIHTEISLNLNYRGTMNPVKWRNLVNLRHLICALNHGINLSRTSLI